MGALVLLQLTNSAGQRYLLTGDAGVDSFESAEKNGFDMTNFFVAQLPHHGSRRNINSNWVCKLNPKQFLVSAAGNVKHPRRAVIECIKKNLKDNCKVYSTHKGGTKNHASNRNIFSNRNGWSDAVAL